MGNGKKRKLGNQEGPLLKTQRIDNSDSEDDEEEEDKESRGSKSDSEEEEKSEGGSSVEIFSGEEEGEDRQEDGQRMTAFNMREEMEEGHFDAEGSFIWDKKEKRVRDNWIDNIGSMKVAKRKNTHNVQCPEDNDDDEGLDEESLFKKYKTILSYMNPQESVNQAIRRLAGSQRHLSTMERLKLKKAGKLESKQGVDVVTALANEILLRAGNTNVYEMTYSEIKEKIEIDHKEPPVSVKEAVLDMYAEDFEEKEKKKLEGSESEIKEAVLDMYAEDFEDKEKKKLEGSAGTSGVQKETEPSKTKEEIGEEKKNGK